MTHPLWFHITKQTEVEEEVQAKSLKQHTYAAKSLKSRDAKSAKAEEADVAKDGKSRKANKLRFDPPPSSEDNAPAKASSYIEYSKAQAHDESSGTVAASLFAIALPFAAAIF